jgi:hypothetical protein
MKYHFGNFYRATVANFTACKIPPEPPDYKSESGSAYWDKKDRVIRWSDHWNDVASCRWQLWNNDGEIGLCGECLYEDFRPRPGKK